MKIVRLILISAALILVPAFTVADETSPTLTAVYSDIGTIGDIAIPAIEVPDPKPFRPAVVAGSISADTDSVGLAFKVPSDVEKPPTQVAAVVIFDGEAVPENPAEIIARGVIVDIAPEGADTPVEIPVVPAAFERMATIVFVGIRYDSVQ